MKRPTYAWIPEKYNIVMASRLTPREAEECFGEYMIMPDYLGMFYLASNKLGVKRIRNGKPIEFYCLTDDQAAHVKQIDVSEESHMMSKLAGKYLFDPLIEIDMTAVRAMVKNNQYIVSESYRTFELDFDSNEQSRVQFMNEYKQSILNNARVIRKD